MILSRVNVLKIGIFLYVFNPHWRRQIFPFFSSLLLIFLFENYNETPFDIKYCE